MKIFLEMNNMTKFSPLSNTSNKYQSQEKNGILTGNVINSKQSLAVKSDALAGISFKSNAAVINGKLTRLFNKYQMGDNPVVTKVDMKFFSALANDIANSPKKRRIAFLTGLSGSGKSTLVSKVMKRAQKGSVNVIQGDNFYYDISEKIKAAGSFVNLIKQGLNLEIPEALNLKALKTNIIKLVNGENILIPSYAHGTSIPDQVHILPTREGGLTFVDTIFAHNEVFKDLLGRSDKTTGISIYLDCPDGVVKKRWFNRPRAKKEGSKTSHELYKIVSASAEENIKPHKDKAHLVINSNADLKMLAEFMNQFLDIITSKNSFPDKSIY